MYLNFNYINVFILPPSEANSDRKNIARLGVAPQRGAITLVFYFPIAITPLRGK